MAANYDIIQNRQKWGALIAGLRTLNQFAFQPEPEVSAQPTEELQPEIQKHEIQVLPTKELNPEAQAQPAKQQLNPEAQVELTAEHVFLFDWK
jgi:hypothetical protein